MNLFDFKNIRIEAFVTMHVLEIEFNGHPVFICETRNHYVSLVEAQITVGLMKGIITNALKN